MAFVSKISKATELYNANPGLSRNGLVDLLIAELGLNKGTATTYYYSLIKGVTVAAKKPVDVAPTPTVSGTPTVKRGRPAGSKNVAKADPIVAAAEVVKTEAAPVVVKKPEPVFVESKLVVNSRKLSETRVFALDTFWANMDDKEKAEWVAGAEQRKNETLFKGKY